MVDDYGAARELRFGDTDRNSVQGAEDWDGGLKNEAASQMERISERLGRVLSMFQVDEDSPKPRGRDDSTVDGSILKG